MFPLCLRLSERNVLDSNIRHLCFIAHIFTKLSQIMCLIEIHWYFNMPDMTASYERFSDLFAFLGNSYILLNV